MPQLPEREYALEDDQLWEIVGNVVTWMTRDETEFAARGVTTADRTAFGTLGNDFENFLTDSYYRGRITSAVAAKNVHRDETEKLVKNVSGYVQQEYGISSGEYKSLKISGYQNLAERSKVTAARQLASAAEDMLPDLTPIGLTQGMIDELRAEALLFEEGMREVASRESIRRNEARERVLLGNSLYSLLVKYCEIGKLIWENINPAYYDDYIIYHTVHTGLGKVFNFVAQVDGADTYELSWDPVVDADTYEVEYAESTGGQPQGAWQPYISVALPPTGFLSQPGFSYWLRVRARNNQGKTGAWSDVIAL
jgi:hypothetical protein